MKKQGAWPRPSTREGKRVVTVYLDEDTWRRLKLIGLDKGCTMQALVEEAIAGWYLKDLDCRP
jgi:hypothetical protein